MYVIGGNGARRTRHRRRQVFPYDVATQHLAAQGLAAGAANQPRSRRLGGKIYAIGGLDPNHRHDSVFVYDPRTSAGRSGRRSPEKLHALAAVVFHGEIWVIGGQVAAGQIDAAVWIYNPRSHRWRRGPSMPFRMETAGASVADGEIHVVLESKYLIYDPNTRKWRRGPSLETPRHALAVYAIDGTLYAMGGCVTPQLEDSAVVEKLSL